MRVAAKIVVTDEQHATLERWVRGRSTPVRLMQRAQIILLAADGKQNKEIADTLDVQASTVGRWRQRFAERGLAGIEKDAPRGGRKPTKQRHWAQRIVETTLHQTPPNATHWSVRTLAKHLGIRPNLVHRVWTAHQLKPHRIETFKLSRDPQFVEKGVDVVGLYLHPPEHALVLCEEQTPTGLDLHLIVDNYNTHKHPKVKTWLKRHPRLGWQDHGAVVLTERLDLRMQVRIVPVRLRDGRLEVVDHDRLRDAAEVPEGVLQAPQEVLRRLVVDHLAVDLP